MQRFAITIIKDYEISNIKYKYKCKTILGV